MVLSPPGPSARRRARTRDSAVERKTVEEPARETPVIAEADVVVAGGGTAGVVAALAAGRAGARTVLVEQQGHVGGTLLAGGLMVQGFYNMYGMFHEAQPKKLVEGLPQEIVDRMVAAGGCFGHVELEIGRELNSRATIFDPETWKDVSFAMLAECGVELYTRTFCVDVLRGEGGIRGIVVENKSGRGAILGRAFIDATGDGDLAVRAGAEAIAPRDQDKPYGATLIFSISDVDVHRACEFGIARDAVKMVARARKGQPDETIVFLWLDLRKLPGAAEASGIETMRNLFMGTTRRSAIQYVNVTGARLDAPLDVRDALAAEMKMRRQMRDLVAFLRAGVPGFENAHVSSTASLLGVRRSRTVRCEYELTARDIREARPFPDEVGRYGWVDIPTREVHPVGGGSYGIPYRALIPRGVDHLLVAGRLITPEFVAHMSTRNTVHCMVQGQAAGTAAALAAARGICPGRLDTKLLQAALLDGGVYLEQQP